MNTDAILDFVVENYVWFIIGGAIIFLAILGFVADKKKIIPKSKRKKTNEELDNKDEIVKNESIIEDDNKQLVDTENGLTNNFSESEVAGEKLPEAPLEILDPLDVDDDQENVDESIVQATEINNDDASIIESSDEDDNSELIEVNENRVNLNEQFTNFENFDTDSSKNNNSEHLEVESIMPDVQRVTDNENDENRIDEINYWKNDDLELKNNISEKLNVETSNINEDINNNQTEFANHAEKPFSLSNVDADIDRINNLKFDEDEPEKDKLEDTMQISYSQLKEIVQDILAENEAENDQKEEEKIEKNSVEEKNDNTTESNVDEMISETKKQQDEEDDVWKF